METINTVELTDQTVYPDSAVIERVLGTSYVAYESLLQLFSAHGMVYEWRYYQDGKAWLCKVQKKSKTVIWMSAWKGYMQATVYFLERHVPGLLELDISVSIKEKTISTKNVGKSKPCIFEVRTKETLADIEKVMTYKMSVK